METTIAVEEKTQTTIFTEEKTQTTTSTEEKIQTAIDKEAIAIATATTTATTTTTAEAEAEAEAKTKLDFVIPFISDSNLELIPLEIIKEIVKHCVSCDFHTGPDKNKNMCVLRIFLLSISNSNPSISADTLRIWPNINIFHFLCLQSVSTKEEIEHQIRVGKLLFKTGLDFDPNRLLKNNEKTFPIISLMIIKKHYWALEMILEFGGDPSKSYMINNGKKFVRSNLELCIKISDDEFSIDFDSVLILLRANADISFKYDLDGYDNIYRKNLEVLKLDLPAHIRSDITRFVKLLKGTQFCRNRISRWVYRRRRSKLIAALNSLMPSLPFSRDENQLYAFRHITPIVADYVIPLLIIHL